MQIGGLRSRNSVKKYLENKPLITIITVVYNDEKRLEKTILSIVNQTYENIEYIIVDGESTDSTINIIKQYEDKIDYWISEPDKGIYNAMNKAIDLSCGEWINFMNSGDIFYAHDVLEKIFSSNRKPFVYSDFYYKKIYGIKKYTASYTHGIINHQSAIYQKRLHSKYGYYIETKQLTISDYIFFLSIPKN
ncbi:hypothetical protein FACS1894137_17110 [Spirochaetia bacterium]|nr:hypothetical protein FACS1894137_17110 [Spirochaetia bacterium]